MSAHNQAVNLPARMEEVLRSGLLGVVMLNTDPQVWLPQGEDPMHMLLCDLPTQVLPNWSIKMPMCCSWAGEEKVEPGV